MVELANYKEKLSQKAQRVISHAVGESQRHQHYYLGPEHILFAFAEIERPLFEETMERLLRTEQGNPSSGSKTPLKQRPPQGESQSSRWRSFVPRSYRRWEDGAC